MKKLSIFWVGFLLALLSQVSWAQQFNVEVLDNQTLPGVTIIGIRVWGTIPQDMTAQYDLYVDYNGDSNFEAEEEILSKSFTSEELAVGFESWLLIRTPSFITEVTRVTARIRLLLFRNGLLIHEHIHLFYLTLQPFTTVGDRLTRTKGVDIIPISTRDSNKCKQ